MKEIKIKELIEGYHYKINSHDCHEWILFKDKDGYGKIGGGRYRCESAHRVSYRFSKGVFDKKLYVLHKCDNPSCVNPEHLFLGTAKDNYEDSKVKGRNSKGDNHGSTKLSDKQVKNIRELWKLGIYKKIDLGLLFSITNGHIGKIINNKIRKI